MPMAMWRLPSWRKEKPHLLSPEIRHILHRSLFLLGLVMAGTTFFLQNPSLLSSAAAPYVCNPPGSDQSLLGATLSSSSAAAAAEEEPDDPGFNCRGVPQFAPVLAHRVEGFSRYPFLVSLPDLRKPNPKSNRKSKFFDDVNTDTNIDTDAATAVQDVLARLQMAGKAAHKPTHSVVDVGADVGMAAFAASAMGFPVLAFEAALENVHKLCDGTYFNRASSVKIFHAAVSDRPGHVTLHKVVGRVGKSAISATGAKLASESSELVPVNVTAVSLDSAIPASSPVLLLKIDVQGWEHRVLKGAIQLLSRSPREAPFIIYKDDDKLLRESNSSSQDISELLQAYGYKFCSTVGGYRHCSKEPLP